MGSTRQQANRPNRFRRLLQPSKYRKELQPSKIELQAINECWKVNYQSVNFTSRLSQLSDTKGIYLEFQIGQLEDIPILMQRWLRNKAKEVLSLEIATIASEMDVTFNQLRVKNQRTLWGSCSRLNNINLNQKLLFLSPDVMAYVLYHELTHLKVFDHSQNFWAELEKVYRNAKGAQKQLRYESNAFVPLWARV